MHRPAQLALRNRQKTRKVNIPLLRRLTKTLLEQLLPPRPYQLCIHLVSAQEMIRLNQSFLHHTGPTDVITFDLSSEASTKGDEPFLLYGEIFVCLDVAQAQAREFQTTWQAELARYVAHGLLHLYGYDDRDSLQRRRMKRQEDRLVRQLTERFRLSRLGLPTIL